MPEGAFAVHGLSTRVPVGQAVLCGGGVRLPGLRGERALVAHNAAFDVGFLNAELGRLGHPPLEPERIVDTLALARRKHPFSPASLDALCQRYGIDNARRVKHGALLDAEILADVYVELLGGRQANLGLGDARKGEDGERSVVIRRAFARPTPLPPRLTEAEIGGARRVRRDPRGRSGSGWNILREADEATPRARRTAPGREPDVRSAGPEARSLQNASRRLAVRRSRHVAGAALPPGAAVERGEVDRIDEQGREAAIAHGVGDDLTREREQQARALDHHDRVQVLLRDVLDAEDAGIDQLEARTAGSAASPALPSSVSSTS